MTSLDDSLESPNFAGLQALMLQEQAYNNIEALQTSPERPLRQHQDGKIALSGQGRPRHSPTSDKTRQRIANSAPDMSAMALEATPQPHIGHVKATTFAALPVDFDGDTQPMPSQIYRDYQSFANSKAEVGRIADEDMTEEAPKTLQEGDAGHIDLMGLLRSQAPNQDPQHVYDESVQDVDEEDETQKLLSSLTKQSYPKTPATVGHMAQRQHIVSPSTASKTPGFELSAFGGVAKGMPMMSNTQMFNMTQALSSPLLDMPRSDPIDSRPSPDFHQAHNSSPLARALSSPTKGADVLASASGIGGPRDMYMPMNESQNKRLSKLRQMQKPPFLTKVDFDVDDDSYDDMPQDPHRAVLQRVNSHDQYRQRLNRSTWNHSNIGTTITQPVMTTIDAARQKTPTSSFLKVNRPDVIDVSDDVDSEADGSVDEYDEYAQEVVASQRTPIDKRDHTSVFRHTEQDDERAADSENPVTNVGLLGDLGSSHSHEQTTGPPTNSEKLTGASVAVADSQPDRESDERGTQLPRSLGPSSLTFVPGSQSPSLSGQTRLQMSARTHEGKSPSLPNLPLISQRSSKDPKQQLPSSPPVLESSQHAPVEASPPIPLPRSRGPDSGASPRLAQSFHRSISSQEPLSKPSSDATRDAVANALAETHFDTAKTHQPPSQDEVADATISNRPARTTSSSQKVHGIIRMTDIAIDPTPPDAHADIDISIGLDIVTAEDQLFLDAVRSPVKQVGKAGITYTKKSRRTRSDIPQIASLPQVSSVEDIGIQSEPESSPVGPLLKRRRINRLREIPESVATGITDTKVEHRTDHVPAELGVSSIGPHSHLARQDPDNAAPSTPPAVLQDKLAASHVATAKRPLDQEVSDTGNDVCATAGSSARTPQSVKKREMAGMAAAAQAREVLFASKGLKRRKTSHKSKQDKPVPESEPPESTASVKVNAALAGGSREDVPTTEPGFDQAVISHEMADAADTSGPAHHSDEVGGDADMPDSARQACRARVLALFRGTVHGFYPATCLAALSAGDPGRVDVRFDDGSTTALERHLVCAFDLRVGDLVKVDLPNMKSRIYVVHGLEDKLQSVEAGESPPTDIHGHQTVALTIRPRESLPAPSVDTCAEIVRVPISAIYITQSMFFKYGNRPIVGSLMFAVSGIRMSTPSTDTSAPVTPRSRSRRVNSLLGVVQVPKPSFALARGTIFANMAFAVSNSSSDDSMNEISTFITAQGGRLLEHGFPELFEVPELPDSSSKAETDDARESDSTALTLTDACKQLGFVAMIADKHCRTQKYMQALALSIPCLSGRWITDSIAASRPLPWDKYLLPAGDSAYLNTIRSRVLTPYLPTSASLSELVESRTRLLNGGGVILVVRPGSKTAIDKSKVYAFLSLALGADQVTKVSSAEQAAALLDREPGSWKWVHGDEKSEDAVRRYFTGDIGSNASKDKMAGKSLKTTGQKRKRDSSSSISHTTRTKEGGTQTSTVKYGELGYSVSTEKCRVVGDKFVIESLILGALIE